MTAGVYTITDTTNGRQYVGSAVDETKRRMSEAHKARAARLRAEKASL